MACQMQLANCCCCDQKDIPGVGDLCPEWTTADIFKQLGLTLNISGIVSFLCMFYIIGAIVVTEVMRQNLKNYKTDYI
jgi:hypothetical protein